MAFRILACKEGIRVTLLTRNDLDRTARFPGVAKAISALKDETLLLDGEIVAFLCGGAVSRLPTASEGRCSSVLCSVRLHLSKRP